MARQQKLWWWRYGKCARGACGKLDLYSCSNTDRLPNKRCTGCGQPLGRGANVRARPHVRKERAKKLVDGLQTGFRMP